MKIYIYKTIASLLCCSVLTSTMLKAQNQNALAFDGVDDMVTVANGSSVIATGTSISLTCWVYPTNTAPAYPDFDGFAGIRDDLAADFFLVQTATNQLEARFRNSAGAMFTINYMGLTLNTWQHYAFTYDGSMIRLYKNAVKVDSLVASGSIVDPTISFLIGNVHFQNADFLLTGKVDEVSLWNRAITSQEIDCIYHSAVNVSSSGLQLYYKLDQGTAGGNNSSVTTATDATGHINGTLNNFSLTGTTSNWVAGINTFTPVSATFCKGGVYNFGTQSLTTSGVYNGAFTSASGCDSTVVLTLTVDSVDIAVTQNSTTLIANQIGATYQWVNCNSNFSFVSGATQRAYTPTVTGSYAVIIHNGSCNDTSTCFNMTVSGISENSFAGGLQLSPNPTYVICNVSAPSFLNSILTVYDVMGRTLIHQSFNKQHTLAMDKLNAGIYVVELRNAEGVSVNAKLIKE